MNRSLLPHTLLWLPVLTLGGVSLPAHAAWVVEPSARLSTSYEDNVQLEADNEDDAVVSTATGQARIANVTERSSISGVLGANYINYTAVDDLDDRTTWFAQFAGNRRYERANLRLQSSARRNVILRRINAIPEEFDPSDPGAEPAPGEPIDEFDPDTDIDENVAREQIERTNITVTPSFSYNFTERTRGEVGYSFFGLRYAEDQNRFQDSDQHSVFTRLNRQISPLDNVRLELRGSRFEPDAALESDMYEGTVGWNRRASERLNFGIDLGARQVDSDLSNDWGTVVRLNATYRTQTGRLSGSLERSVLPSSFGDLVEADRLNLSYDHRFGPLTSFRLGARAYETRRDDGSSNRDRQFFVVQPSFNWDFAPAWNFSFGYEFRWTDRANQEGSAQGNAVTLGLIYRPPSRL